MVSLKKSSTSNYSILIDKSGNALYSDMYLLDSSEPFRARPINSSSNWKFVFNCKIDIQYYFTVIKLSHNYNVLGNNILTISNSKLSISDTVKFGNTSLKSSLIYYYRKYNRKVFRQFSRHILC